MSIACRNCLSTAVKIEKTGLYAPFFMKRVFGIDLLGLGSILQRYGNQIQIDFLEKNELSHLLQFKSPALTSIRVCHSCGFVGPDLYFSSEMLTGLYEDYRSDSYNRERCQYEPEYLAVQDLVGKSDREVQERLTKVVRLLRDHVDLQEIEFVQRNYYKFLLMCRGCKMSLRICQSAHNQK